MTEWMRKILGSKHGMWEHLATRSFSEKVAVLEKLRDRSLAIARRDMGRKAKGV